MTSPVRYCACGHFWLGHHRTPSGRWTYCTHMDATGACTCPAASDPIAPAAPKGTPHVHHS